MDLSSGHYIIDELVKLNLIILQREKVELNSIKCVLMKIFCSFSILILIGGRFDNQENIATLV